MKVNYKTSGAMLRHTRLILILATIIINSFAVNAASQIDLVPPTGNGTFGSGVIPLPNGNIIVSDPGFDLPGPIADVGAVYLYNGKTGALISTITGSTASDGIGAAANIVVLSNGNFVFRSPNWDNGAVANVGAATFCSGTTGCSGVISSANSIIGSTATDNVSGSGVTALSNGNYIVRSQNWDSGAVTNVGAITFCNGTTGCTGTVSAANSLVGSTASDTLGAGGLTVLPNNNFIVNSNSSWDNGAAAGAGAITFCSGTTGCPLGAVSAANSLVGSTASDNVGTITVLTNGNFVVSTSNWDNGATIQVGAFTFCSGTTGCVGAVSAANSLIGVQANDGNFGTSVTPLANGNYVIRIPGWANGAATQAGATALCNGTTGCTPGAITSSNALVGTTAGDGTSVLINPLSNSNYVVAQTSWDNPVGPVANVGSVTFCSGITGCTGAISAANSLTGTTAGDQVGSVISALTNSNYVVRSTLWDDASVPTADVGAVTWCSGTTGCVGMTPSAANSLIGSTASDMASSQTAVLTNGNYVIRSQNWNNGAVADAGAATWCDGTVGCTGAISPANSLVGSNTTDQVGSANVITLPNGNFIVLSQNWANGAATQAGAVTWCSGTTGCVGPVSVANSMVGSTTLDQVGFQAGVILPNNNYVFRSTTWDNGAATNAGAATVCNGTTGCTGAVSAANSLVGTTTNDQVGSVGAPILVGNGNYVVGTSQWDNGATIDVGAVTWCNGTTGCAGAISTSNSLHGTTASDAVGTSTLTALANGNYIVRSSSWDNGATANTGHVSYCGGNGGCIGPVSSANSVLGTASGGGSNLIATNALDAFNESVVIGRTGSGNSGAAIFNPTYSSVADGNWSVSSTWDFGASTMSMHDYYIPDGRTVRLDGIFMPNSLRVDCTGAVTGASSAAYIIGNIRKDFCATGMFRFPVGTTPDGMLVNGIAPPEYTPFTANVTAIATVPSSLTVSVTDGLIAGSEASQTSTRYWDVTETGDLTADISFVYLNQDIVGYEQGYQVLRREAGTTTTYTDFGGTVVSATNTGNAPNVSNFSQWAAGNLVPLAANVSVGGRVTAANGAGIRNAIVSITDSNGVSRRMKTGAFGYYNFDDVEVGGTYIISVASKRFTFANPTQIVTVNDNIGDLNFTASP